MKNLRKVLIPCLVLSVVLISADHIDAPEVQSTSADITDFYCFQGQDNDNLVFVANYQGLLSPSATAEATFDDNVLTEFNIDNDGDNVEDLVIQVISRNGKMYLFGPSSPSSTSLSSTIVKSTPDMSVDITNYGETAKMHTTNGISLFAGPRDDPFFMDFAQYGAIISGNAGSFNDPGADTFAGTNVLSIVVEVPKNLLGSSDTINTWVESKK